MKMLWLLVSLVSLFVGVWIFFPVTIEAEHERFESLSPQSFMLVRDDAARAGEELREYGIQVALGDEDSQSIEFGCKGVPVLTVINNEMILSVLTYSGASRAPGVILFRNALFARLHKLDQQPIVGPISAPGRIQAFVMKVRDGINMESDCSKSVSQLAEQPAER